MQGDLSITGKPEADELLNTVPLALLIGMLLDQQVPMERAFLSPHDLKERMGGRLDAAVIAEADSEELAALFSRTPALHRFPKAMAARTQELCRIVVERFDGRAGDVWKVADGNELLANLKSLPGFGDQKARIFVALLAKRLGVRPADWEKAAGPYAEAGFHSVADIDGPEALRKVREHKKAMKAATKAAATASA